MSLHRLWGATGAVLLGFAAALASHQLWVKAAVIALLGVLALLTARVHRERS